MPQVSSLAYPTIELLDEEFVNLRDNERKLEQWVSGIYATFPDTSSDSKLLLFSYYDS